MRKAKVIAILSALLTLLLLPISPNFTIKANASDAHGPRLVYGNPVRHTITSCATNPGAAVACILSLTMKEKGSSQIFSGEVVPGKKIAADPRIANSERALTVPATSSSGAKVLKIFPEAACHSFGTDQSLQFKSGGQWVDFKKFRLTAKFSSECGESWSVAGLELSEADFNQLLTSESAKSYEAYAELLSWSTSSSLSTSLSASQVRFRIADANNAWEWFSSQAVTFQWPGAIPEPKVERGFYEEWTFPRAGSGSAKNVALLTDFQPAGAKWCWSEEICDDRREEVALAISPINNKELWKDNQDLSFTVTIRMPRSFGFGEVSGSAQNVLVRYGKNLPAYNGVETREVIATLTPIPTARGGTPTQVSHQAETITYDANIWIYGQKNSIVDQLGECGRIGGVQVVSNAMHSLDPTWNAATESIDVRLSTPHLKPDGSINTGYLEVRVPEQAAACMWKINLDGSIRAVVDITYEDGSKPSVATVVGNKIGSDYLIISSGFHYSSPTLKVKLAQSATTFAADKKKTTTITCIKGAQKRVIKGINPNCPKGFVRKSA